MEQDTLLPTQNVPTATPATTRDQLAQWLSTFKDGVYNHEELALFDGDMLLGLTEEQLRIILGPALGASLYNKLHLRTQQPAQPVVYIPPPNAEAVKIIELLNIEPMWKDILKNLSGIEFPSPPTLRIFTSPHNVVRALPAVIKEDSPDLRLLSGSLGVQNATSKAVEYLLNQKKAQETTNFFNPILFLSGSGVGKTKAMMDLLRREYGIYLDWSSGKSEDTTDFLKKIGEIVQKYFSDNTKQQQMESECVMEAELLIVTRAVAFIICRIRGVIRSPEDWLFTQMNGIVSDYYDQTLLKIRMYLRQYQKMSDFRLIQIFDIIRQYNGARLWLMIDEANMLLNYYKNCFTPSRNPNASPSRALFSLVMAEYADIQKINLVVAGTRLEMGHKGLWESSLAKLGVSAGKQLLVYSEFPMMILEENIHPLVSQLVNKEYAKQVHQLFRENTVNPIRLRFFTTYVEQLSTTEETIEEFTKRYFSLLYGAANKAWTIPGLLQHYESNVEFYTLRSFFCKLVVCYLTNNGVVNAHPHELDWISTGLCRLTKDASRYKINEGIILRCIMRWLKDRNVKLCEYYVDEVLSALSPSEAGFRMDVLVALSFYDLDGSKFSQIPCFRKIEAANEHLQIDYYKKLSKSDNFLEEVRNSLKKKTFILPKHTDGPDGFYLGPVTILISNKTSQDGNVETVEVDSGAMTTVPQNLLRGSTSKNAHKDRDAIVDIINKTARSIVQLNIVLPEPAQPKQADQNRLWKKWDQQPTPDKYFPQNKKVKREGPVVHFIGLTLSNIGASGLFTEIVCQKLNSCFQNPKNVPK